jgi:NADH dehydrogenase
MSSSGKTIAVTGATGFVGRSVVRALLDRGHRVRALVRTVSRAREVLPTGTHVALIAGDVCDAARVDEMLAGAHACVHLVGIIREVRTARPAQTFERMHVEATRTVVGRCEAQGVRRYVHMSALGASATCRAAYGRTKFEGEQVVQRSGLDWTIFRPGLIHGPEGEFTKQAAAWATGLTQPFFFMPYFRTVREDTRVPLGPANEYDPKVAPVAVEDVAGAFAGALDTEASVGEIYNLVGPDEMTWPAMLRFIRDNVPSGNRHLPPYGVPGPIAARVAKVAALAGVGSLLPFDEGMAWMGSEDSVATLDKARAHLGFAPKAFKPTFQAYAGVLNQMG